MATGDGMKLTVIGCSDAFGSGGRLQTCFHVRRPDMQFLIDCGATSLIGLEREDIDPNGISVIFISHLHGDHFSGLVWWLLHARHVSHRSVPLTIVGPAGLKERLSRALEALFPGASQIEHDFELTFIAFEPEKQIDVSGISVVPYVVSHPSGAPSYALRFMFDGKVVVFSGDTEWVDALLPASADADLFIAECFGYEADVRYHMTWRIISRHLPEITAKTVLLTHMGPDMLSKRDTVRHERVMLADDGLILDL